MSRLHRPPLPIPPPHTGGGKLRGVDFPPLLLALVLAAATCAVYAPVRDHAFVNYDDDHYILRNQGIRLGITPAGLEWAFTTFYGANWFPLTWLTWIVDHALYGLDPAGFHLTNVALHVLASVALLGGLVRMTKDPWRSAFVAGVFALHPLHVESVAWAAARKDVLSGVFWMLTLWTYARYRDRPGPRRYSLVALCLALGLMSKPMLVTVPFVLLLLDVWPLNRFGPGRPAAGEVRRALVEKLPLLALAVAAGAVTVAAQRSEGAVQPLETFPVAVRVLNAQSSYAAYLGQTFWPRGLAVFYPHPGNDVPVGAALAAGLVLAAVTVATVVAGRRRPWLAVGWLWFVGTLIPVIGLVQVGQQARADRYTYLPLIGLSIAVAWGVPEMLARVRMGAAAPVLGVLAIAGLAAASVRQVHVWRDSVTLFEHALRVTRDNAVAHLNLGIALLDRDRFDDAATHLEEALRLHPGAAEAHGGLGEARARQGRIDDALEHFGAALRLDPRLSRVHNGLGRALMEKGQAEPAVSHFREAMALDPGYAEPVNNLGAALLRQGSFLEAVEYFRKAVALDSAYAEAHNNWGVAVMNRGESQAAIEHFKSAATLRPAYAEAQYNWGLALAGQGAFAEAAGRFEEAISRVPDQAETHYHLGLARANQGDLAKAAVHFRDAAALDPKVAEARYSLGLALAGLGRLDEAVSHYRAAVALRHDYPEAHDALGVALARLGRPADAVGHFREAISLRPGYAQAYNDWGLAVAAQGRIAEAVDLLRKAVATDAAYPDAHVNLGVFLAQRGRIQEAADHFRRALALDPSRTDARDNLEKLGPVNVE